MLPESKAATINPPSHLAVRFSRVIHLPWLIALGTGISVGLGIYTLLGQFMQLAPTQAAQAYLLMVIVALPLTLTYAERAAVIPGSGGAFNLARASGVNWLAYICGWILLGGYICLIALLGWGAALHINLLLGQLFDQQVEPVILAVAIIGSLALNNLLGTSQTWKTRFIVISAGIILLSYIILRNLFALPPDSQSTYLFFGGAPRKIIGVITLMVSSLWGLHFILNVRDEIHRPTRTILPALLITTALAGALGVLAALGIFNYPEVIRQTLTPLVEIIYNYSSTAPELVTAVYALLGLATLLIALNQGLVGSVRLQGAMAQAGFFPEREIFISGSLRTPVVPLFSVALLGILLIFYVPIMTLVGLAAMTFLWASASVHLPDVFRKTPKLPEKRRLKLPFHPLLPGLTAAIGLLLPLNLNIEVWGLGSGWLLLGIFYYTLYARQSGLLVRRREVVVAETAITPTADKTRYRVMVALTRPKTATPLIQAGARLANANQGDLLVVRIIILPEQMPAHLRRAIAQKEWETLNKLVEQVEAGGVAVTPLVRLAPTQATGILEMVREENVDLLLLSWPDDRPADDINLDPILDPVISIAPCDVAVLRGRLPQVIKRIFVPTAGGPHASRATALSQALIEPDEGQIFVVNLVEDHLTAEREAEAEANLAATLASLKSRQPIERRIIEVDTIKTGILTEAESCDLLLMGVSKEGFLGTSTLSGLPAEVAYASPKPTILVRQYEQMPYFWLQRLWSFVTDALPKLTPARRDEVALQMRQAAQPTVDFFVLILLSATIATIGLLQNSGAVIIGAMLVAPLMSPILAMGISMVQGNLNLLRVAAESTLKGIFLAIFVAVVVTLISPLIEPTGEITNRTSPNLLDLMIAIASGTAAAYAVSRKQVAAALPGVAIAVSLVPPLGVVGYGFGTSQLDIASGALLLFLTNLTAIIFASALTFLALGFYPKLIHQEEQAVRSRGLQITMASLLVLSIILGLATVATVQQSTRARQVESIFRELMADRADVVEVKVERTPRGFKISPTLIVFEVGDMDPEEIERLEVQLIEATGAPVTVEATILEGIRVKLYE